MVWYSHLLENFPLCVLIHTVKGFGIVNKAEVDVFLELSRFFGGPMDVANLISGSSAFSKSSLYIWKFMVHVLLKPGERVTGRKAKGLQTEEIACKCQTFLSLLSGRRKQTSDIFFPLLFTNLKGGFS